MRRILQSKLGVSILCLVAALCCVANFVKLPARRGPLTGAARGNSAIPGSAGAEGGDSSPAPAAPLPLKCASALAGWRSLWPDGGVRRDPFQFADSETRPSPTHGLAGVPSAAEVLTVQAISLDDQRALAVINRRVVGVGEWVGDYQVVGMTRGAVEVTSRWGRATVEIAGRGRRENAGVGSSGAPVGADPSSPAPGVAGPAKGP